MYRNHQLAILAILLPLALSARVPAGKESSSPVATNGTESAAAWSPQPLARYEPIVERMPFGHGPPAGAAAAANAANTPPPPPPVVVNQLVLYAINRTPAGQLAVGFGDNGQKPPHNYYLMVGEEQDGCRVVTANFKAETAIVNKDGVDVFLKLGGGNRIAQPSDREPADENTEPGQVMKDAGPGRGQSPAEQPRAKAMFTNVAEQLLSMELSVPPGIQSPPLPITPGVEKDARRALASVIVIETNDTDAAAAHKETIGWAKEELRSHLKEGGSTASYLQTLKARRAAEIDRQKKAREAAEARIQELATQLSQQELARQAAAINKTLTDNGVEPVEVPGTTPEEEAAPAAAAE